MSLQGKTVFITGGSRGIGKAMALKLAGAGANIVIAAKSVQEDPRLGGTIFSAAAEVEALGVKALAVQVDIRDEAQIAEALKQTVEKFGGIEIVINNVKITPNEVKDFLTSLENQDIPMIPTQLELSQLVILPKLSSEKKKSIKKILSDI